MGKYENQLNEIVRVAQTGSGPAWQIRELDTLTAEMAELQTLMTEIAASPGWTGTSADLARENLAALRKTFSEIEAKLTKAQAALAAANRAHTRADNAHATLPGVAIPDWIYDEVKKATAGSKIWIPFVGEFAVESAISRVQEFFGAQRESAAYSALTTLQAELRQPREDLANSAVGTTSIEWPTGSEEPIGDEPSWRGDDNGDGGWGPHAYSGGGGPSATSVPPRPGPPVPFCTLPPEPPTGWPHTTIGIDGEIRPGSLGGGAGGGLGGRGAGVGGGGLGAGLLGAGAGAGALVVGSKLANGGGGLLGGAGAGAGAGGAGAGGGKSSSAMMGGAPGGGGGGSQKEKRNGLGLIAPKLEDDDETGPRAAAAGAGGRD
jgi:hypothetical protein